VAKKVDLKAKAKRQKILAGVLGVIFLGVAGFMGPKTLKQLTGPKVDPLRAAQEASTTTTTSAVAPPSLSGSATPAASGSPAQLAAAPAATASLDQLTSFSRFASKDPFVQQVTPGSGASSTPSVTPSSSGSSGKKGGSQPRPPAPAPTTSTTKTLEPAPTAAVIAVNNGPAQLIHAGDDFPLAPYDAIFHLVSLRPGAVKIAIAGGSYTSGAPTVTLKKGKPLTLENTADGTRYVLKLFWTGAGQPPAGLLPTTTTGAATVTPPAATTTTATTP
jgi:hypothetical protein